MERKKKIQSVTMNDLMFTSRNPFATLTANSLHLLAVVVMMITSMANAWLVKGNVAEWEMLQSKALLEVPCF
jgi:hypothetical protein